MTIVVVFFVIIVIFAFVFKDKITSYIFPDKEKNYTIDDRFNSEKKEREKEIDRLLSKIGKNGVKDLSAKDKKRLDELSKK